jgi:hypothetical protein
VRTTRKKVKDKKVKDKKVKDKKVKDKKVKDTKIHWHATGSELLTKRPLAGGSTTSQAGGSTTSARVSIMPSSGRMTRSSTVVAYLFVIIHALYFGCWDFPTKFVRGSITSDFSDAALQLVGTQASAHIGDKAVIVLVPEHGRADGAMKFTTDGVWVLLSDVLLHVLRPTSSTLVHIHFHTCFAALGFESMLVLLNSNQSVWRERLGDKRASWTLSSFLHELKNTLFTDTETGEKEYVHNAEDRWLFAGLPHFTAGLCGVRTVTLTWQDCTFTMVETNNN